MNYAELTDDELRLEVAKRCGWTEFFDLEDGIVVGISPEGDPKIIPDYASSIAAAYALEDALPVEKCALYAYNLTIMKHNHNLGIIHASAADRCRAWLWTMDA